MTLLEEWVGKAEDNYLAAVALSRRRSRPLPDTVCFHCQQCAEKYLKALPLARGVEPPHTHELEILVQQCAVNDPWVVALRQDARHLSPYAVTTRYPGTSATPDDARAALQAVRRIRRVLRRALGV